jgi:hypothetical protein
MAQVMRILLALFITGSTLNVVSLRGMIMNRRYRCRERNPDLDAVEENLTS